MEIPAPNYECGYMPFRRAFSIRTERELKTLSYMEA
jgi:hypothetical protein